jgi:uncharacterized protein (TIGR02611 family)
VPDDRRTDREVGAANVSEVADTMPRPDDPGQEARRDASAKSTRGLRNRLRRVRRRIRRNRTLDATWRVGVFVVGAFFVIAGLVMFVAPGPGWLTVILGLAILSTEFEWAHRLLHWTKEKAQAASAKALDPAVRKRNLLIGAAVLVVVVAVCWWWVAAYGLPGPVASFWEWVRSLR